MRVVALTCSSVDRILVYPVHSNRSAFVYDPLLLLLLPLKTNFQPALVHYLDYDLSLHSFLEQISYNIFLLLLANLSSYFSSLLDDKDDNQRSLGAIEADGPSSSLLPAAGLTSPSLESMIPVNTLIMARPDCTGPRPLAVQLSVEAVEWA